MEYIDVKTASEKWNITERRVTYLCRNGRIEGAKKEAGLWLIPSNSVKPEDGRKNKLKSLTTTIENLPLPIGVSNYIELVENYYYVDKTLMIKDFLDSRPKISLFTRPRRFGKTLTMDMLKTFFEISENDTSVYFKDKNIWNCGEKYRKEQGKYPVISVTFKDIKYSTWEQSFAAIRDVIVEEYKRHIYILDSNKCNDYDKKYFLNIINQSVTEVELAGAFSNLSKMLNIHHNKPAIIIIDEYDTPIHQGFSAGYYDLVVNFMRNLLSGACKDNSNLAFGFLTGIMRVAKESIFSGLNNLAIHSILDTKFSEYFGFTKDEILSMAAYYNSSDKYKEICRWYNGYKFGNNNIFNPWSVINYFYNSCKPKAYWQSTGDNSIIKQLIENSNNETYDNLYTLLQGNVISSYIDSSVIYPEIMSNTSTVFSFLLSAGYLKVINTDNMQDENGIYDLAIPNKEISYVYEKEILSALSNVISESSAIAIQQALKKQDVQKLQEHIQDLLLKTISSFDYAHENFYHGFILGICAIMNNQYQVKSNRESGYGRYDIQLEPYNKQLPGIIIEVKVLMGKIADKDVEEKLELSAKDALKQIKTKKYIESMKENGISKFFQLGVAFYKKHIKVITKND